MGEFAMDIGRGPWIVGKQSGVYGAKLKEGNFPGMAWMYCSLGGRGHGPCLGRFFWPGGGLGGCGNLAQRDGMEDNGRDMVVSGGRAFYGGRLSSKRGWIVLFGSAGRDSFTAPAAHPLQIVSLWDSGRQYAVAGNRRVADGGFFGKPRLSHRAVDRDMAEVLLLPRRQGQFGRAGQLVAVFPRRAISQAGQGDIRRYAHCGPGSSFAAEQAWHSLAQRHLHY